MGSEPEDRVKHADSYVVLEDRLHGKPLENVSTFFIKPSTATSRENEWLFPSKLDMMFVPFYTPILCTFTLTEHKFGSVERVVQHLKDSLADALVPFYPLAGRVVSKDGPPRIHCNDAGAAFTEASVDVELAVLRTDDFQPQPLLSGLTAAGLKDYPALPQIDTGLPALIIQVTHFKCGGITLAANWAHVVADGKSGLHFMKSWSELARGLQISLLPDHRRDLVKPRKVPVSNNPFKASTVSAGAQITPAKTMTEKLDELSTVKKTGEVRSVQEQPRIAAKTIEFSKDDIAKLKNEALDHDPNVQLSRADCLSTHLWRTFARAKNLPSSSRVRLIYLVEGRTKLSLPPGYFGNVIGFKTIITTVDELLNGPFESTASLIHSAISSVTADWFQDLVDFMVFLQPGQNPFGADEIDPACTFGVSYLIRFPFYELDFGFGIPAHSMRNTMGARDGLVFVVPSSHGPDHMVAMANFNPEVMTKFVSMAQDIP
ncbi:hypothetical protein M758_5G024600 [Ceratodon purpureus]|nr:hypothetical protein M758_5G024600 [Ceratodon purpureus]